MDDPVEKLIAEVIRDSGWPGPEYDMYLDRMLTVAIFFKSDAPFFKSDKGSNNEEEEEDQ